MSSLVILSSRSLMAPGRSLVAPPSSVISWKIVGFVSSIWYCCLPQWRAQLDLLRLGEDLLRDLFLHRGSELGDVLEPLPVVVELLLRERGSFRKSCRWPGSSC